MQKTLIMNKLPLPRYYDGQNWNTVFKPTRKSIPKYLHEDLPELKLLEIKQQFKQIGKFNCPRLDYFANYIKHHKVKEKKGKNSQSMSHKDNYDSMKQELQYALLLCDHKSSVLDELVSKAKKQKPAKTSRTKEKGRYFEGTIDLVFRNRKNLYLSQQKKKVDDSYPESARDRVERIEMLPFD